MHICHFNLCKVFNIYTLSNIFSQLHKKQYTLKIRSLTDEMLLHVLVTTNANNRQEETNMIEWNKEWLFLLVN